MTKKFSTAKQSSPLVSLLESLESFFADTPKDTTSALKKDHKALRNFIDLLKDTDADLSERRRAYVLFSSLLASHSQAEEQIVYKTMMRISGKEMHLKISEGFVEHQLADDLMKRIAKLKKPLDWSAHANVISEIVEHHLKEEERDLFPLIDKSASPAQNQAMLKKFLALRQATQMKVTKKNAGVVST